MIPESNSNENKPYSLTRSRVRKIGAETIKEQVISYREKAGLEKMWFHEHKDDPCENKQCERTKHQTIDHIIPKQILLFFGIDSDRTFMPNNLQILCRICNAFKANRLDFTNPRTKELLQELLNEV